MPPAPTALLAHPCSLPIEPYLVGKPPSQRCLWAQQIRAEAGSPCHNGLAATGVAPSQDDEEDPPEKLGE